MSAGVNNPTQVLLALDGELDHEVRLVLYGRAALALGFDNVPVDFETTQDVDVIIMHSQLPELMEDEQFWEAQDQANLKLQPQGLYITHLFAEDQVFLRPEWAEFLVRIKKPATRFLRLFRPHVIDLILTKMMRGNDPQDMEDIAFLIRHEKVSLQQMEAAFESVRIPAIQELQEAFDRAAPVVRSLFSENLDP